MRITDIIKIYENSPDTEFTNLTEIEDDLDEMALKSYTPIGDFTKTGPFRHQEKRLVTHPTNLLKTGKFFERTPYDFRLFFSNIPGTGKYREYGPMSHEEIRKAFGQYAEQIIEDSDDAITIVFVGNVGADKVMLTPWIMAHRLGHAIQAGARKSKWHSWVEAERHFFSNVNQMLEEYYGKRSQERYGVTPRSMRFDLTPEYNALFNAIGTQRSSRQNLIRRPYEFLYEIFAQYLGTGTITFNPLPSNLGYGRQAWGRPTKYLNIKPEFRDETERRQAAEILAYDMELMFNDVLSQSISDILVM